jgi:hypothetical protein
MAAMAKFFQNGDFRSGYYRDQTYDGNWELTIEQFFAGLYGNTSIEQEPMSAGRQMGRPFCYTQFECRWILEKLNKTKKNSSADISLQLAKMPRLLGLAQASKIYRRSQRYYQ